MMYERMDCRLCGHPVKTVLELEPTPLANLFPDTPYAGEKYPLELKQCVECGHVQIGHVVDDETLYGSQYKYQTPLALKPLMNKRAEELYRAYPDAETVLEIGANNGLFLHALHDAGFPTVVGIDPSSTDPLVWKWPFNPHTAEIVLRRVGTVDLIVANNVFAHIDDLKTVFDAIQLVLSPDGSLVFEVQYLVSMMESGAFDMIYHEHRDYHHLKPLAKFLKSVGLVMRDFEIIDTHGGSIRVTARKTGREIPLPDESIDWGRFKKSIDSQREEFKHLSSIAGFGAPAKATTLIYQLGLQSKITHCVDDTPQKQGKYIGGTNIKVVGREGIENRMFLLSWNYEQIISKNFPNVEFVVPFKELA